MTRVYRRYSILQRPLHEVRQYLARKLDLPHLVTANDEETVAILQRSLSTLVIHDERLKYEIHTLCQNQTVMAVRK